MLNIFRVNAIIASFLALACVSLTPAFAGNVFALPNTASVQNIGASAPSYPDIYVVNYSGGNGASFHWTPPCPSPVAGVAQITISAAPSGCYVQSPPVLGVSAWPATLSKTANYTVTSSDVFYGALTIYVNATSAPVTLTIPPNLGSSSSSPRITVIKTDSSANPVIITTNGSTECCRIISKNDAGGAGSLLVSSTGSSLTAIGMP